MIRKRLERGSLVSYGLIGVLLLAALVGGIVLVRQRANQARQVAKTSIGRQDSTTKKQPANNKTTTVPTKTDSRSGTSSNSGTSQASSPTDQSSNLPQSGPTMDAISLLAIALISGTSIAFVRSSQKMRALYL